MVPNSATQQTVPGGSSPGVGSDSLAPLGSFFGRGTRKAEVVERESGVVNST